MKKFPTVFSLPLTICVEEGEGKCSTLLKVNIQNKYNYTTTNVSPHQPAWIVYPESLSILTY